MIIVTRTTPSKDTVTILAKAGLKAVKTREEDVTKYRDTKTGIVYDEKPTFTSINPEEKEPVYAEVSVKEDKPVKVIDQIERCCTSELVDIFGNKYQTILLNPDSKVPADEFGFSVVWREDDVSYDTQEKGEEGKAILSQHPWPTVKVLNFDEAGNEDGTRFRSVGRVAR